MTEYSLPQGAGYGIILGVGCAFALGMIATTHCLKRYNKEKMTSEEFSAAGRNVNSSLIGVGVISSWCWPTSILVSTSQVYNYGVCGGLYYAAGCGSVCFIFALLAIEVKRKAPYCHTYLELIRFRFGVTAHAIYIFFALAVNIIVTVELINGASVAFNYLTGMHIVAASFLAITPVGIYTLFGGLKATFLTDYIHSIIMLVIALVFAFNAYSTNSEIGSPGKLYDMLHKLAETQPVEGNAGGSYMTIKSHGGGIFLVIALSSAMAPICLDQGYWNKALAASQSSVLPGYIMGGIAWCSIPIGLATVMGLSARALGVDLTASEVSAGLVLPSAAIKLMGQNGAACAFLLLFMSVTSAASAEMVSASTICCYDIYRSYINPRASDRQLIMATHLSVVGFILGMVGFSLGLYYAGVDLGYLFDLIAIICGGALVPAILTLFWSGLSKWAVILSPILGTGSGIAAYLGTTDGLFDGVITVATAGSSYPSMAGMLVSCGSPLIYIAIIQLFTGHAHYDFALLKSMPQKAASISSTENEEEKNTELVSESSVANDEEPSFLTRHIGLARALCLFIPLALIIIWPMPMYGSHYIFSKPFFTGWIVVSLIWLWTALLLVTVLPLWQGRRTIAHTVRAIMEDVKQVKK